MTDTVNHTFFFVLQQVEVHIIKTIEIYVNKKTYACNQMVLFLPYKYRQQMGVIVKVVFRKRLFITVQPYTVTGPKIVHIVNCMILS